MYRLTVAAWYLQALIAPVVVSGYLVLFLLLCSPAAVAEPDSLWILVDTDQHMLFVMDGDQVLHSYTNISIGRGGVSAQKRRRDGTTPLGEFRVVEIVTDTAFHRFFRLDYPNLEHARKALESGMIGARDYRAVEGARSDGRLPPQNTPLGGHIGIHGVGAGEPAIHERFNWTNGCIALGNDQIDDLARWMKPGRRVVVR